jgi:Holliday junction resolvase RusA-like endonuclease
MVEIIVPGTPIAMPRSKGFYNKNTGKMHHYYKNEKVVMDYKHRIQWRAQQLFPKPLLTPISLEIEVMLPRPKGMMWKKREMPRIPHGKRPDIDNLAKAIFDSLTGVVYLDDGQISTLVISKKYHAGDEGPQTVIRIEEDTGVKKVGVTAGEGTGT